MNDVRRNLVQRSATGLLSILIGWVVVAGALRLHNLMLKPLWTDEFSTLVFGLGNSFSSIPLDQVIDEATLLSPTRLTAETSVGDAAYRLLSESNHPPLYFMLTHLWVTWFSPADGYVSIWAARVLSVMFGVLAVPAMYWAGWTAFRSRAIAYLSAALMAVSPFGIYLAQDARHYTLTVLWAIVSITFLCDAVQRYVMRKPLPLRVMLGWVGVNALGMASHYFFVMTLAAEAIALSVMIIRDNHLSKRWYFTGIRQLCVVSLGTASSILVWAPFLFAIRQGDALTSWLDADGWENWAWVNPLLHTLGSIISMVMLFPVQNVDDTIIGVSAIGMVGFAVAVSWYVCRGLAKWKPANPHRTAVITLLAFLIGAIATMLLVTYGLGLELAQVFRYHFFYFPGVLLLIAVGLSAETMPNKQQSEQKHRDKDFRTYRRLMIVLIVLGLVGSLTVTSDLGYRKLHRPDRIVKEINKRSEHPVLIAISHQTHGQTGRLMALAWEMRSPRYRDAIPQASFLLDHQQCTIETQDDCHRPTQNLRSLVRTQTQPTDLWLINYEGQANLRRDGCDYQRTERTDGYKAQHYTCHL
ncbi:MAG: glycosyltransferase [Cyanobacteria bacterium J06633_2]